MGSAFVSDASTKRIKPSDSSWSKCFFSSLFSPSSRPSFQWGMGGGILCVPILLFAGFSIKEAPVTSLILIVATSAASLLTFWRKHKVDWKLALVIDPPTDMMAFVGGIPAHLFPRRP